METSLVMTATSSLGADVKTLLDKIRTQCRAQREHWQQVPLLALQANGRSGYSDRLSMAYNNGYWLLEASIRDGYYRAAVDCATGEIVNPANPPKPAADAEVLRVAASLSQLDAALVCAHLRQRARGPISAGYPADHAQRLDREIAAEQRRLKLGERFVRR